ncbi:hypothetical protein [Endozoicomonas sp. Mp262]|uniref:hypothetical protein n=1 Tax=Endozoicomonas sp. Mp262 TaxID=2919499 RepID=UPI0021D9766C
MATIKQIGEETVEYLEDENLIKVTIPIKIIRKGGSSHIYTPEGATSMEAMRPLEKALIQGHRWLKMMMKGKFSTVKALAEKEGVDKSRVSKCIRLTGLAPDIQEAILCKTGTWVLMLSDCMKPFPLSWSEQHAHFSRVALISPHSKENERKRA